MALCTAEKSGGGRVLNTGLPLSFGRLSIKSVD